jgi:hypothetical protein
MELTIEQALQQGVAAHKEGKLEGAECLYWAILQSQPAHPDANFVWSWKVTNCCSCSS